jgi:hypothetical protein
VLNSQSERAYGLCKGSNLKQHTHANTVKAPTPFTKPKSGYKTKPHMHLTKQHRCKYRTHCTSTGAARRNQIASSCCGCGSAQLQTHSRVY